MKQEAIRLRKEERLSTKEISDRLKLSYFTVADWVRFFPLTEEERRKKMSLGGRKPRPEFEEQDDRELLPEELRLKWFGLGLYAGEGSKSSTNSVELSNCDPEVIKSFLAFLRTIFKVREGRLRAVLQLKDFHNVNKMTRFWSKLTGIPESQFGKPTVTRGNDKKNWKIYVGTCRVRYSDHTLLKRILELIALMGAGPRGGL